MVRRGGRKEKLDPVYKDGQPGQPPTINISYYKPTNRNNLPFMPVEFAVAAYRFGHSMARPAYTLDNMDSALFIPLFDETGNDLRGNRALPPRRVADWKVLFPVAPGGGLPRSSRKIDARLSIPLGTLPESVVPSDSPPGIPSQYQVLPHIMYGLPRATYCAGGLSVYPRGRQWRRRCV